MNIAYPIEVEIIFNELKNNGFKRYIVGGCVRDILLNKEPNDWDICTDASPEDMERVFGKYNTIPTGIKHGTMTVVVNNKNFEVTTFRTESDYADNRRPNKVEFTSSIFEDLKRRDFTINALAYNEIDGLIDCFNGLNDIINENIKSVGNPNERFQEDALRIIRGVRFATQLGFKIDKVTALAMSCNRNLLENISKERIRDEFSKILIADKPSNGIKKMISLGLMEYVVPELIASVGFDQKNPNHDKDVFNHIMHVVENTEKDLILRLAALFHDIGKPQCFTVDENEVGHFYGHHTKSADIAETILDRLRFDNNTIETVKLLVREHMSRYNFLRDKSIKKFINKIGIINIDRLLKLQVADIKGSKPPHDFSKVDMLREECLRIINLKEPMSVKDLNIDGYDIMKLGINQGIQIGKMLEYLLNEVLDNPELNDKEKLIKLVEQKRVQ